jgi:hypothetical protein
VDKPFEIINQPINLKIFFRATEKQQHGITFNHYSIVGRRQEGHWLNLLKNNGEEVMINLDNVNQVVTI